jgi:PKD repeat protein
MKTKLFFLPFIFLLLVSVKMNSQCAASFTFSVSGGTVNFTNTSTPNYVVDYTWDFGDATPAQHYYGNPMHSYNAAGTYTVSLAMYDSTTTCSDTFLLPVTVTVGCNNLSDSITVTDATSSTSCDGTAQANVTGGTAPYAYQWSNLTTTASIINLCTGTYNVVVTDANGCMANASANVNCPPFCQSGFTWNVSGNSAFFWNTSNDTTNATFQWSFGDAGSSAQTSPMHTYATPGAYNVMQIMVNGFLGCTDTTWQTIYVGGPNSCASSFSMVQDSFNLLLWYIYPTFNGQAPYTYLWDFGDSTTSTAPSPTHNYASPGHYTICLSVTDANSCTSYFCDSSSVQRSASSLQMQSATVINPTGIEEQETFAASVFPDPANDVFYAVFNKPLEGTIRLTDLAGKPVYEHSFSGKQATVDVSQLPQGIYNCNFSGTSFSTNRKVVIVR